jgi:hypothetical protein
MPLILDVLTHIDQRSAAAGARELEQQFERSGEAAGVSFGGNLARGLTGGFRSADFESMTGVLSSAGMVGQAASHGKALGVAFAGGITVAAAAGLVDLGVKVGETFEKINRDITLHTAASGKALEELKSHADALVGSLDSSASHLGSDMATLATRLQMGAGKPLDDLAKNVEMLRDRMGNFNVGAMAGALQNMGVTGANANDVLASLAQTVQRTDIPLSELATNLAANSELFKAMHLTAEQAGAMLGQLSAKGVPAATAIMGLQMGMKEAAKEGVDFNAFMDRAARSLQYYQEQIAAGKNVAGNEAAAEAVSLGIGGPRKWTDELAAINALQKAKESSYAGDAQYLAQMAKDTATLGNQWEHVKNAIDAALAPPGMSVVDVVAGKMDGLIKFIDAHANDLRQLFETSLTAIGDVVGGLANIGAFLGRHPVLIDAITLAFEAWVGLKAFGFVLTGIESIVTWLGLEATTAVATGATVETASASAGAAVAAAAEVGETAMLGLAATLGTIVADLLLVGTTAAEVLATAGDARGATAGNASDKQKAGQRYQQAHGGQMPPGYQQWLQGEGPMPAGMGPYMQAPGAAAGAPGQPPAGQGTGRFGPGQGPDVGGRAGPGLPGAPVAPGTPDTGGPPGDLLTPGDFDASGKPKKGPRLPEAPQVPYGAGYGAPPGPGESAEQYSREQDILEKRHGIDETTARLNQLEKTNADDADAIQKAKNDQLKAISEYNKAELEQTKKHASDMSDLGAKIDKDFGVSKGLAGIADNLTRFLGNLMMAGPLAALNQMAAGAKATGGSGLIGMAASAAGISSGPGGGGLGGFMSGPFGGGPGSLGAQGGSGAATGSGPGAAAPALAGGGAPGAPAGANLDAWITAAETAAGVDASWTSGLKTLIGRESGGNPNAINLSDSNALAGHPSQGLMQTIPGTFAGNHVPGTSGSITDPVANIAAGIRYIQGRYGGIGGVQQANPNMPPKGYAGGGGPSGTDTVPAWLTPGEEVFSVPQVTAMGGPAGVASFKSSLHMAGGDTVPPGQGEATHIGGGSPDKGEGSGIPGGSGGAGAIYSGFGGGAAALSDPVAGVMSFGASIAAQEAQRAIKYAGQLAGVGAEAFTETFLPTGASKLAQNSWLTRIGGGLMGAQPQIPNMAGKSQNSSPAGVPGMTPPMMTPPQEVSPFGPARGIAPGASAPPAAPGPVTNPSGVPAGPRPGPSSVLGDAAVGPNMAPFQGPSPNSVVGPAGPTPRGFDQGGSVGSGSSGPLVHIEHFHDEGDSNSAGQDIGRHVESSYAAQSTPGRR